MTIRLVTFDLDDTLWPVGPVIVRAEHRMRDYLDKEAPEVHRRIDTAGMARIRERVIAAHPGLSHDLSAMRRQVLMGAVVEAGYADAERIVAGAFETFMDGRHDIEYFEGALDTLAHLARHYTLGALSNGNASVSRLGLDRYFDFHLSAASVGRAKPAPEMFERALQEAGVGAEAAVHIGDHARDDVVGAARIGMATVWVNRGELAWEQTEVTPTWEIRDLTELAGLFPGVSRDDP